MMYHVLNAANNHKMAEAKSLEEAIVKGQALADQHQQDYSIFQLVHCCDCAPKPSISNEEKEYTDALNSIAAP